MYEPDSKRAKLVLENVTARLEKGQELLKKWIESQQAAMKELEQSAEEVRRTQGKEISRLTEAIATARTTLDAEENKNAEKKMKIKALTQELDEVEAKCEKIKANNDANEAKLTKRLQERKERYEAAQKRKAVLDDRVATAHKMLRLYQESLGITLDIVVNKQKREVLLIGFKYVDAKDPEKLFGFGIYIKDEMYEVENCLPSEPPNLREMLDELNTTGNLAGFLAGMRRYFKSLTLES